MQDAKELARQLAHEAEAVCRHYLSKGRREGRYWLVGDARNIPGRSLFVRLTGPASGKGAIGRWLDAASGEHGDLLDIIREASGLRDFRDVVEEARRFLGSPRPAVSARPPLTSASHRSTDAPRRLFAMAKPIAGTVVETYLRNRGITALHETAALRYHPSCYYRADGTSLRQAGPAMIAAVTDLKGRITGVHRTWLDPAGCGKIAIAPTASISIICGGASACIEPIPANIYNHKTLSGAFVVRNPHLSALLAEKGMDTQTTWTSILEHEGSVQHLDCLDEHEKAVFRTAFEIDQRWLLDLAADRAPYVCQSQSLNLYIPADVDKWDLHMLHWSAWAKGIKSLYYCRSKSVSRAGFAGKLEVPRKDYEECLACQ